MTQINRRVAAPEIRGADPDVALARGLGALTAHLVRHRDALLAAQVDPGVWRLVVEASVVAVIDTFSPLVPEYRGRCARALLLEVGPVRLVQRIARCEPGALLRQGVLAALSLSLAMRAAGTGAQAVDVPSGGAADLFFAPSQRRAARRLLENVCGDVGALGVRIDFTAAWRTGSAQLVRALDRKGVAGILVARADPGLWALAIWLFLADSWTAGANPVSIAWLTATQLGYERWTTGSDAFRQALTEALVLATRSDIALDDLKDVNSLGWARVLTGDLLEWAASVLARFHEAMERPEQLASFRVFDFMETLELAGRRARRVETIEDHVRRLAYRVVRLDDGFAVAAPGADPGERIPDVHELRARVARANLTKRERQVLTLCARDMDYRAIGEELGITPATARVLMMRARRAMGTKQHPRSRTA